MAPDKPRAELYDFLYRDTGRIASYYAQLFGGHLTSLEKSDADRRSSERTADLEVKAGQAVAADVEVSSHQEILTANRNTVDPHEVITTDVLNALKERGYIHPQNPLHAPHGALVLTQGTAVFLDRSIIQMSALAMEAAISSEKAKPGRQQDRASIASMGFIKSMMDTLALPSAFLLDMGNGGKIVGTVKESGMEEPISTYYFRHGPSGLSNVYLVGIKEVSSSAMTIPGSGLMAAGQQAVKALSEMLFPTAAIRVTPVVLFRKL